MQVTSRNRRHTILTIRQPFRVLLLAALMLPWSWLNAQQVEGAPAEASRKPNIVIILADDLGYGDVTSYYPKGKIPTPRIDALAAQGMRFTDAHSGAAVCSPTRYGLLTGQHFLRVPWSRIGNQVRRSMIDDERLTLPEMLQQAGYHTGAFGKWHLGQTFFKQDGSPALPGKNTDWRKPSIGGPNDHGFDVFFGVAFGQSHWINAFMEDRLVTEIPTTFKRSMRAKAPTYEPVMAMPETIRKTLEYIDWNRAQRPGQPFFAYLALPAVHTPLVPTKEFLGKSDAGLYGDFVLQVDASVGRVLDHLQKHRIADNTLVVFSSDNGSHGMAGNGVELNPWGSVKERFGHNMNGNWRGTKGHLYEGGHRVPLIARWPGKVPEGTTNSELVTLEDLMATIAAIIEVELPTGSAEDSYNLLPYLTQQPTGEPIRRYAVLSTFRGDAIVRSGDWVLSFILGDGQDPATNTAPEPDGPRGQLYNLALDPDQSDNVWLQHPEVVDELSTLYEQHVASGHSLGVSR